MAERSGIQWTDSSLSLWFGCTQVSPACDHCYAMRIAPRLGVVWNAPPRIAAESAWAKIEAWQRGAKRFRKRHGRARRVFINHLSDFFDNQAEQTWRDQACLKMELAPDVVFILVTKRPQLAHRMVPVHWMRSGWPPNVWLLVTAENQVEYDRRCVALLDVPAPIRGVSIEPMLEPITPWAHRTSKVDIARHAALVTKGRNMPRYIGQLRWSIIGGESGRGARSMPEQAVSALVSRLRAERTAVFFKQRSQADHGAAFDDFDAFPKHLQIREFPTDA